MRAALISPYYLSTAAAADRPGRRSVGGVRLNVSQHMMTPDWRCFTSTLAEDGGSKLWMFCESLKVILQNVFGATKTCSWDGQPSMVLSGRFSGVSGGMKAIRLILKVFRVFQEDDSSTSTGINWIHVHGLLCRARQSPCAPVELLTDNGASQ